MDLTEKHSLQHCVEEMEDEPVIDFVAAVDDLVECVGKNYKPFVPKDYSIEPKHLLPDSYRQSAFRLVNNLLEAKVTPNGTIDVDLGIIRSQFHTLLIRKSYIDLARMLIERIDNFNYLVLGSSGNGKTVFCIFFMYLLLQANKRYGGKYPFIFDLRGRIGYYNNGLQVAERGFIDEGPDDHSMFILYDDMTPPPSPIMYPDATTVMFSPPNPHRYKEFQKEKCRMLFLPLWSKGEFMRLINTLPSECPEKLSESELDKRMMLCGGLPRRIFEEWDRAESVIRLGISKINVKYLEDDAMDYFEAGADYIIGIEVAADYHTIEFRFLSDELRRLAYNCLKNQDKNILSYAMSDSYVFEDDLTLFPDLFKMFAMESMSLSKEYNLVPLNAEATELCQLEKHWLLKMPSAEQRKIKSENDVILDTDLPIMWIPNNSSSFADYFYTLPEKASDGGTLLLGFKFSMNPENHLDRDRLKKLIDKFGKNFILVWVLTGKPFEEFQLEYVIDNVIDNPVETETELTLDEMTKKGKRNEMLRLPEFKMNAFAAYSKLE